MTVEIFPYELTFTDYYDMLYAYDHEFQINIDLWLKNNISQWYISWSYDHLSRNSKFRHIFYFKNEEDKNLFALTWL